MKIIDEAAAVLRSLADEARMLPPPDHKNPHAFYEAKDDLGNKLARLSALLTTFADRFRPPDNPGPNDRVIYPEFGVKKIK